MSQNKTVIQGLEPADSVSSGGFPNAANQSFYSRGGHGAGRGTVVPGMMEMPSGATVPHAEQEAPQPRRNMQSGKPVVGFLYSVSRTPAGEFWPLQIGRNSIGQSADNDIVLAEGTVSSSHAVIVTRQVKSGVIAALTDSQSTNGTMINGETIGFSAEECHNGDIITIGNNYELVLILIDASKLGLSVSKDFIAVDTAAEEDDDVFPPFDSGGTRTGGFNPFGGGAGWGGGYSPAGGTVGMDGSVSGGGHGGTIPM